MDNLLSLYLGLFTDVQAVWRPMMGIVNEEWIGRDVEGRGWVYWALIGYITDVT